MAGLLSHSAGDSPEAAEISLADLARQARSRGGSRRLLIPLGRAVLVAAFLGLWQVANGRWLPDFIISSPLSVANRLVSLVASGQIVPHVWTSLQELVLGYLLGVSLGIAVGVVLGLWPAAGVLFEPLIAAINGIPKIALAPLFLIWLGIGITSKVAIASMSVFFVLFYNTYLGMRTVPQNLVDALRLFGANRWTIVQTVVLPSVAAPVLAGLRAGIPFAMIGVVVGEMVAADRGVGYYIRNATELYDSAGVFAGIVILVAIILVAGGLLGVLERRLMRWRSD
jgi:NitT/TauT family transport system permease protein